MSECRNLENVGQVEELLLMTEQMQDELDQKDQTIQELNRQVSESLTLNEKLNSENRAENIEALRTRLRQTEERLTSETDSRKRADAEAVAWKFKYEKAEQEKLYAQTHQKTVEVAVEKKVPYEKCEKCDRTAYRKAKEKCDSRKSQLEKKYKNMTIGYESILFLLAWYSITTTLFTAILSPVFLNDCIVFFGALGKGISIRGVKTSSLQGDKAILPILQRMGAKFEEGPESLTIHPSSLHGIRIDASDCPDLVPILSVAAALAKGTTEIIHAERLRLKECDRLKAMASELTKMGAHIEERPDGLIIRGVPMLHGAGAEDDNCSGGTS